MTRGLRAIALLVLLMGVFQIAMCATDCDCFLPLSPGISSHSSLQSDADGCLCCAQYARVAVAIGVPVPVFERFERSKSLLQIPQDGTLLVYRPPRS
jgi:hypothetical protein